MVVATSVAAIIDKHYSTGLLNIPALALYLDSGAGGRNPYCAAPHRFREDMIRIAVPPLSNSYYRGVRGIGVVYILPCRDLVSVLYAPVVLVEKCSLFLLKKALLYNVCLPPK
jgi:hypothetical protein